MKRRFAARAIALLLAFCAVFAGCSRPPSHPHELRLTLPVDPESLSPLYAFAQDQIALDLLWCQTLVGLDERNRFVPILVTRVPSRANGDISADGLRITYHLRPDVRFADGVPLTSADVAYTYRAILEPANDAPTIDVYEQRVAALETPDKHTVVVRLRGPWSAAVHTLFAHSDEAYGILPEHAFASAKVAGSAWEQKPFGTGPFRVTSWERGEKIELEPNPYYAPRPKLARITVRIVPNQTAAFAALQAREVDAVELNPDNLRQAAALGGERIVRTAENGIAAVYLQTASGPTSDIRVRRAIADALDFAALRTAWHDIYPAGRSVFPPPVVAWNAAPLPAYPHGRAQAARELDAAGWRMSGPIRKKNGTPLALLIVVDATRPIYVRIAVALQAQLAAVGADATIKTYTSALMAAPSGPQRTGRFAVLVGRYIGGSDAEQSLNLTCSDARSGGGNYARYCSARFEALFARQMHAATDAERVRVLDAIAALVHADAPLIPLFYPTYIEAVDERVTGLRRNMLRFPVRAEEWDAR